MQQKNLQREKQEGINLKNMEFIKGEINRLIGKKEKREIVAE